MSPMISTVPTVTIQGEECMLIRSEKDTPREMCQVAMFYRGAREFIILASEPTEQQAIDTADAILSNRERFGCLLITEGTRLIKEAQDLHRLLRPPVEWKPPVLASGEEEVTA